MKREPAIIHFTTGLKPWNRSEWNPYTWLYIRNLLRTPFWGRVLRDGNIDFIKCCKIWLRYRLKRPPLATIGEAEKSAMA
jgi:lipopolysaccharide biosynthesis glycosyltransferase